VPASTTVKSAHLYLYSVPNPFNGNLQDANYGDNGFSVQQVATDWSPSSTSWFNQPAGLTANQVIIPSTTQSFLDMNIDVTAQVASMISQNKNYGFLLKLLNEAPYASRMFVCSSNQNFPDKHPKLVIEYQ